MPDPTAATPQRARESCADPHLVKVSYYALGAVFRAVGGHRSEYSATL